MQYQLTHLDQLEAESMQIIREVAAEFANPVMLYSIGKDSMCMLHVARKAFYPAPLPFPLLHIDTTWNFRAMIEFRDQFCAEHKFKLLVHTNWKAIEEGINPFDHSSQLYTTVMNTHALIEAMNEHKFDAAFGGGRRDEEKSRAKERVYSFRDQFHQWDPKNQRPELWNTYNGRVNRGESIRVFPLSNWTELDIWQYIHREQIPLVPLYFAAERPVVNRNGAWIMVDDERFRLLPDEKPQQRKVRFRTMGDYPLTGAHDSDAETLVDVIQEMLLARTSERQGRLIDHDEAGSMEQKKREGYF
jgi:sulfate adenylyltransferase subunit 2